MPRSITCLVYLILKMKIYVEDLWENTCISMEVLNYFQNKKLEVNKIMKFLKEAELFEGIQEYQQKKKRMIIVKLITKLLITYSSL